MDGGSYIEMAKELVVKWINSWNNYYLLKGKQNKTTCWVKNKTLSPEGSQYF